MFSPNRNSYTTLQIQQKTIKKETPNHITVLLYICVCYMITQIKCLSVYTADSTMLYAGVPLLITVLLLPVVALIFCRGRDCKPKGETTDVNFQKWVTVLKLCAHYSIKTSISKSLHHFWAREKNSWYRYSTPILYMYILHMYTKLISLPV